MNTDDSISKTPQQWRQQSTAPSEYDLRNDTDLVQIFIYNNIGEKKSKCSSDQPAGTKAFNTLNDTEIP